MCMAVTCPSCGKVGWRGCGAHVEAVLRDVPVEQRCTCQNTKPPKKDQQRER